MIHKNNITFASSPPHPPLPCSAAPVIPIFIKDGGCAAISEPFYFLHLLAFFSYFAARSVVSSADDGGELHNRLLRREIQAVLVFLVLFTVKIVKEENWETFIADSLLYAKVTRNYRAQQMSQYVPSMPVTNSMSTSAAQVGTLKPVSAGMPAKIRLECWCGKFLFKDGQLRNPQGIQFLVLCFQWAWI